jgi:malate permease and related proteins
MKDLSVVAYEVLAVYLIVGAGMLLRGVGWLKSEADASVTKFTAFLLIPCLFFSKVVGDEKFNHFLDTLAPIGLGFGTTVLGFLFAGLIAQLLRARVGLPTPEHRSAFTLCTGMYNYGYIPYPLAMALCAGAFPTMIVFNVGVEIALWTVGIVIITGGLATGWWKHILNPPALAIVLAVAINAAGWAQHVPFPVMKASTMLGQCAVPVGLLVSGAVMLDLLRQIKWHHGLHTLLAASVLRLGVLPVLFLLMAKHLPISMELKQVLILQAAMPAAMFPIVVTRLYKQDTETAVRVVVGTSVLGLLTIPLWVWFGRWWVGGQGPGEEKIASACSADFARIDALG